MTNSLLRARAMMGVPETLRELGADPAPLLSAFHLKEEMIADPRQMMPYLSLIQMLEKAAQDFDCPDFGMRVGLKQGMSVLGPVGIIAQNAATVGEALQHIIKYIGYHSPAIHLRLDPPTVGSPRGLHFEIAITEGQARAQTVEMSLLLAVQVIRILIGEQSQTCPVHFRHGRLSPRARYRTAFKSPVSFNAPDNAVFIPAPCLQQPILQSDPVLKSTMEDYVARQIDRESQTLKENVRALIISLLPLGQRCTLAGIADHLALGERTLQRRLRDEGAVFEELIDHIRKDLARAYLKEKRMPLSQVARLTGYGRQASFNRACLRWFGEKPSAFRQTLTTQSD